MIIYFFPGKLLMIRLFSETDRSRHNQCPTSNGLNLYTDAMHLNSRTQIWTVATRGFRTLTVMDKKSVL